MRKLALLFVLVFLAGVVIMTTQANAADDYLIITGNLADSTYVQKGEQAYSVFYVDTITIGSATSYATDTTIDLGFVCYNFQLRSLNGAGDSGSCTVTFASFRGIAHHDSVARNIYRAAVGLNTADDYLFAPIGSRYIYVRPVVGGTADSVVILEIFCAY